MRTAAQKAADERYREKVKGTTATLACSLPVEEVNRFKKKCAEKDTTPNAVLSECVRKFIEK